MTPNVEPQQLIAVSNVRTVTSYGLVVAQPSPAFQQHQPSL